LTIENKLLATGCWLLAKAGIPKTGGNGLPPGLGDPWDGLGSDGMITVGWGRMGMGWLGMNWDEARGAEGDGIDEIADIARDRRDQKGKSDH
jgi:hypothetical protein